MSKKTFGKGIDQRINSSLAELAYPTQCKIIKVYEKEHEKDENFVDIESNKYGKLKYIKSVVSHEVGDTSVLIFLDNNFNNRMVI